MTRPLSRQIVILAKRYPDSILGKALAQRIAAEERTISSHVFIGGQYVGTVALPTQRELLFQMSTTLRLRANSN